MPYKICALIPTHNHYLALEAMILRLKQENLDILIVDDGSNHKTKQAVQTLSLNYPDIHLLTFEMNEGKGKAIYEGLIWAKENGYTHVFQIDADGQHSLDAVEPCMILSKRNPQALISGQPIYDQSMPTSRRIGRWFTHVWVWVETLSFRITDSMCGFRIYPVCETIRIIEEFRPGRRMDFDTEVMVRLFWTGTPVIMSPVKVTYPEGNLSNFDVLRDNWRLTKMHTKLVFWMLAHLVSIVKKRPDYQCLDLPEQAIHWASMKERAPLLGLFFLAFCYSMLGKRFCTLIGTPIVFYYYLVNKSQRQASKNFLKRALLLRNLGETPKPFKHFMAFFEMALDKFAAWTGKMKWDQVECAGPISFDEIMNKGQGCMLLVSHLGNMEFCRAAASLDHQKQLHVLLHSKNAQRYQQLLRAFTPLTTTNILEVTEIGPDTLIYLKDRIAQGECVVMAGDRIPIRQKGRVSFLPFMGKEAPFAQGPYILASLLECPVYMAVAIREKTSIKVFIDLLAKKIVLERSHKTDQINNYISLFAQYLEMYAIKYPYQWFNFFDFWKKPSYINNDKNN